MYAILIPIPMDYFDDGIEDITEVLECTPEGWLMTFKTFEEAEEYRDSRSLDGQIIQLFTEI